MKTVLFTSIFLLVFTMNTYGQIDRPRETWEFKAIPKEIMDDFHNMGTDGLDVLNSGEGKYFNYVFQISASKFDFVGKKVGFLTLGVNETSKESYFKKEKERYAKNTTSNNGGLYIFDEIRKKESGGYDAVLIYWYKKEPSMKHIIKRLTNAPKKVSPPGKS